jgi:predicted alpha/beta-fold hydrolase
MNGICLPALALNALNDPFVPAYSLPNQHEVSSSVTLWQPQHGGHVGFAHGPWSAQLQAMPNAVGAWLMRAAGETWPTGDHLHG